MSTPNQPWQGPYPPGNPPPQAGFPQPVPGTSPTQMPLPPQVAVAHGAPYPPVPPPGPPLRAPIPVAAPVRPVPVFPQSQPLAVAAPGAPDYPAPPAYSPQPIPQPYAPPSQPIGTNQPLPAASQMPQFVPTARPATQPTPVVPQPYRALSGSAAAPIAARPIPVSAAARPIPVTVAPNTFVRPDEDENAETEDVEKKVIRTAPPWLISTVVHMVALLVAGLIYYATPSTKRVNLVVYSEEIGVQLQDPTLTSGLMEKVEIAEPMLSKDVNPTNDPFAAPPDIAVTFDGVTATNTIVAPSIGMALSGREKGAKEALLGAYGGTATTEESVRRGLEWLKRNQEKSGLWSLAGPYADAGHQENRVAATAMALIAFQGAGHTHKTGNYQKEVGNAWKALLQMQDKDGLFFHEGVPQHRLYSQAQATIALCELYGMTNDEKLRKPAQLAIDYALKVQAPEGGWRYEPRFDSDLSVTGWFVMALQSAMMAGLEAPSQSLDSISKFLDTLASEDGSRYLYHKSRPQTSVTMTAEALLCRQYLGWAHDDPRLVKGVEYLNSQPIDWSGDKNTYYWYYATQVTHHMEGEPWKRWNAMMRQEIPKNQDKDGSWNPDQDRWGSFGGRLYETCLCIYMLEVYYRHLPIYKWRGK